MAAPAGPGAGDTTRIYRYGEVTVSADPYPVSAGAAGAVSYGLRPDPGWAFGGPGRALSTVRNLHLVRYGGGMSLQTVSIRGMGAEHTLILFNGMPAGNMQTGVSDLSLFNAAGLAAIQVVPGGASDLYGSAAVGGIVNLVPAIPFEPVPSVSIGGVAGSFGESGAFARAEGRPTASTGISVRAGRLRGRGDYPFSDPGGGPDGRREGNDYSSRSLGVAAGWRRAASGRIGLVVEAMALDQGSPGPWSGVRSSPDTRRYDSRIIATASYERGEEGSASAGVTAMYDGQYERFLDPGGTSGADNHYRTSRGGFSVRARYPASDAWVVRGTTDAKIERASGNAIDRTRERIGASVAGAVSWSTPEQEPLRLTLTPSVRIDAASSFTPAVSPRIGLNAGYGGEGWSGRLHASAAAGSRNPTMNELWYAGEGGEGNPALGREESVGIDAGLGGRVPLLGGQLEFDLTWYRIRMADRIQWVPTANPRVWTPRNIGRTMSQGWEFGGSWAVIPEQVEVLFDYSIIDSRRGRINDDGTIDYVDQLIYVPLDKGSVGLRIDRAVNSSWLARISGTVRLAYTGERFILDDNSASLPGHTTADGSIGAVLPLPAGSLSVLYAAGNLTSGDHQVMPGYPMPRFHHSLSIVWNIEP